MAGPATQAAANEQAIVETLASKAYAAQVPVSDAISLAQVAVTADDWTGGDFDDFVYDADDGGDWTDLLANRPYRNSVFYARSGPLSAPYGGGWDEDQFED